MIFFYYLNRPIKIPCLILKCKWIFMKIIYFIKMCCAWNGFALEHRQHGVACVRQSQCVVWQRVNQLNKLICPCTNVAKLTSILMTINIFCYNVVMLLQPPLYRVVPWTWTPPCKRFSRSHWFLMVWCTASTSHARLWTSKWKTKRNMPSDR